VRTFGPPLERQPLRFIIPAHGIPPSYERINY
jgi:hypothetical protein